MSTFSLTRSPSVITLGGGAPIPTPLGDATYWGEFADYAALSSIPTGEIRLLDTASVLDLGGNESEGTVTFVGTGIIPPLEGWVIKSANSRTFADLESIVIQIVPGAIANVATGLDESAVGVRYVYDGTTWLRAPSGINFQFPLVVSVAALSTIPDPQDRDIAIVFDPPFFGRYLYDIANTRWDLELASFPSVAAMNAYADTQIIIGGLAIVDGVESTAYFYDGASWVRTPGNTSFLFPSVALWGDLAAVEGPEAGDLCRVLNLGTANSTGTARWGGSQWELSTGYFATQSDYDLFAEPIVESAIISIGPEATYFDSLSYRQSGGIPFTWESTDLEDLNNPDPSGIGVTQIGDILQLTLTGGIRTFRLVSFTSGGGNVRTENVWVPVELLTGGTLTMVSRMIGTEADRSTCGLTDDIRGGNSSITGASDTIWTRAAVGNGASNQATMQVTGLALGATQQIYARAIMRAQGVGTVAGARTTIGIQAGGGGSADYLFQGGTAFGPALVDASGVVAGFLRSSSVALLPTSGGGELVEMFDEGASVLTRVWRDGALFQTARRNNVSYAFSFSGLICSRDDAASGTAYADWREVLIITRTP